MVYWFFFSGIFLVKAPNSPRRDLIPLSIGIRVINTIKTSGGFAAEEEVFRRFKGLEKNSLGGGRPGRMERFLD